MFFFDLNAMPGLLAAGPGDSSSSTFIITAIAVIVVLVVLIHLMLAAPRAGGVGHLLRGYGSDIIRYSLRRTWAVSGVCFAESVRKRVLWLIPLAILGVIVVTRFQDVPVGQDVIRQTIKYCLFASTLVMMLTAILLACSSLPKEMESKVIFTIVTKPITRMEIVAGKILGFARVSATILLIMGLFTWGYVHVLSWGQLREIDRRLMDGDVSATERLRLQHFSAYGLLTARGLAEPYRLETISGQPGANDATRCFYGEGEEDMIVPFSVPRQVVPGVNSVDLIKNMGLVIRVTLGYRRTGKPDDNDLPPIQGPLLEPPPPLSPALEIDITDNMGFTDIPGFNMVGAATIPELAQHVAEFIDKPPAKSVPQHNAGRVRLCAQPIDAGHPDLHYAYAWISPAFATKVFQQNYFGVRVAGSSDHVQYVAGDEPVAVFLPFVKDGVPRLDDPAGQLPLKIDQETRRPTLPTFRGSYGVHNEQTLRGGGDEPYPFADFQFRGTPPLAKIGDHYALEFTPGIERSNSAVEEGHEDPTRMTVQVIDIKTGQRSELPEPFLVESRSTAFLNIPASLISSGDFDIVMRCQNDHQTLGLFPRSLVVVVSEQAFAFNLAKSLLVLWMMSLLVIAISIFCSTFLSWPIAIILTIVLLLARTGVALLADTNAKGLGAQVVNDWKMQDPNAAFVVRTTVDKMAVAMNNLATILPDMSQFDAITDIEHGMVLPAGKIGDAAGVLLIFALPASVLAYMVLRAKEVEP